MRRQIILFGSDPGGHVGYQVAAHIGYLRALAGPITPSAALLHPCQPIDRAFFEDNGLGRVTVTVTKTGETDRTR